MWKNKKYLGRSTNTLKTTSAPKSNSLSKYVLKWQMKWKQRISNMFSEAHADILKNLQISEVWIWSDLCPTFFLHEESDFTKS